MIEIVMIAECVSFVIVLMYTIVSFIATKDKKMLIATIAALIGLCALLYAIIEDFYRILPTSYPFILLIFLFPLVFKKEFVENIKETNRIIKERIKTI
jgi:hypothetical protein